MPSQATTHNVEYDTILNDRFDLLEGDGTPGFGSKETMTPKRWKNVVYENHA